MEDFIPTRAVKNKRNAENLHEVTVFESYKKSSNPSNVKKRKIENNRDEEDEFDSENEMEINEEPLSDKRQKELEMKRLRHDILKFGMSGFEKTKAKEAKMALAISLGAKPPKNKRINYKKVLEERKRAKASLLKQNKNVQSGFSEGMLLQKKRENARSKLTHKTKDKTKLNIKEKRKAKKNMKTHTGIMGVYGKVTKEKKGRQNQSFKKGKQNQNFKKGKKNSGKKSKGKK